MASTGSFRSVLGSLWPNTLCKFWGLHAGMWSLAAAALVLLKCSAVPLPLVAANFALCELLYRNQEDAGTSLASGAGVYFAMHAAALWRAPEVLLAPLLAATGLPPFALRCLRLWHAALAIGSFSFAIKAANKDRAFGGAAGTRGLPLPTLALINSAAGAKMGEALAASLREEAARRRQTDSAAAERLAWHARDTSSARRVGPTAARPLSRWST